MFTERSKGKRALETVIVIILALLAVVSSCLAASPGVMTPRFFRYGIYGITEGSSDGVIKQGDGVIAENTEVTGINDYMLILTDDGGVKAVRAAFISSAGGIKALFVIDKLGAAAWFLHSVRYIVWGFWGALLVLYIVLKATAGAREAKKHREKLTNAFDYYGKLYADKEDRF